MNWQESDCDAVIGREYDLLHPALQRWVYDQGWSDLRPVQKEAVRIILRSDSDLLISAATAGGKTEAAFLPVMSDMAYAAERALAEHNAREKNYDPWAEPQTAAAVVPQALVVSPLKALINDQASRLKDMAERVHLPVTPWHGDISSSVKQRYLENPSGILLITPESLEAMFVLRGSSIQRIFKHLEYVCIDELHAFMGSQRGVQMQSLIHRIEQAARVSPRRIGLSATLADMQYAAQYLRPPNPQSVRIINDTTESRDLLLLVKGYTDHAGASAELPGEVDQRIADDVYSAFRGRDNLLFVNARASAELYSDRLSQRCAQNGTANEFFPHHSSLSRAEREATEARLKSDSQSTTAVCTSTLELGIDVGTVHTVGQIGPPVSVSGLRQRLGRSGRRGEAARLMMYSIEDAVTEDSDIMDTLMIPTVRTVASLRLLLRRWLEPPHSDNLNYSTLIQQIMSVIAERNGIGIKPLYSLLSPAGPFSDVTPSRFHQVLQAMSRNGLIVQDSSGTLLLGTRGEKEVNGYEFYTTFPIEKEWKLRDSASQGKILGTLPQNGPIRNSERIVFNGRRWIVVRVDVDASEIYLKADNTRGYPPSFATAMPANVSDGIASEMRAVYEDAEMPEWLDRAAFDALTVGKSMYRALGLEHEAWLACDKNILLFPWRGDVVVRTMAALLRGVLEKGVWVEGAAIRVSTTERKLGAAIREIAEAPEVPALELAHSIAGSDEDIWNWVFADDEKLSAETVARRFVDTDGAYEALRGFADML